MVKLSLYLSLFSYSRRYWRVVSLGTPYMLIESYGWCRNITFPKKVKKKNSASLDIVMENAHTHPYISTQACFPPKFQILWLEHGTPLNTGVCVVFESQINSIH